jgi:hypothetical protein
MERKEVTPETPQKIPVLDLLNLGAFQICHGNRGEWVFNNGRGALLFNADERFYELSARFNSNELVPVQDFVAAQRELKAQLYALKAGQR